MLKLSLIRTDGGTQPRARLDEKVIEEYAEEIRNGAHFPAVTVFYDGKDYWLGDGFHRVEGHRKAGKTEIDADIQQGSQRDAVLHSVGANATHGLRRTNEDKRRAVKRLLNDKEWELWSDREIARRCGVHHSFVGRLRPSLATSDSEKPTQKNYTTKHGTKATMKTANIGRIPRQPEPDTLTVEQIKNILQPAHRDPDYKPDQEPEENEEENAYLRQEDDDLDYDVLTEDDFLESLESKEQPPEGLEGFEEILSLPPNVEDTILDIEAYIETVIASFDSVAKHQIVNETIKRMKRMSIELNKIASQDIF